MIFHRLYILFKLILSLTKKLDAGMVLDGVEQIHTESFFTVRDSEDWGFNNWRVWRKKSKWSNFIHYWRRRLSLYEKEIKLIQSNRSIIRQVVSFSLQYKMNAHRPRVQFSVESSPNLRQPHLLIQNSNIFLHESRFKAL